MILTHSFHTLKHSVVQNTHRDKTMAEIYLELSIVLLSIVIVLLVLLIHIIRQTLDIKRQYFDAVERKNIEKQLWIDGRHESEGQINGITVKIDGVTNDDDDDLVNEKLNLDKMVTFTKNDNDKKGVENEVVINGHSHHHHHHHHHQNDTKPIDMLDTTTTDVTEYSEYCVPNCEPSSIENDK
ncbi:hypothetical protein BLOT_013947 [Blomia tropicalis]|nr:hypothetical protein BLOT_013947 [Blomia tropicalis]